MHHTTMTTTTIEMNGTHFIVETLLQMEYRLPDWILLQLTVAIDNGHRNQSHRRNISFVGALFEMKHN